MKLQLAQKEHKSAIKRFYRHQHYSASFKGLDHCFIATLDHEIIASLMISQIVSSNTQLLLHGLVTHHQKQNIGIASQLIEYSIAKVKQIQNNDSHSLICFISPKLSQFYIKNGFNLINTKQLNPEMLHRFNAYERTKKDLMIYKFSS